MVCLYCKGFDRVGRWHQWHPFPVPPSAIRFAQISWSRKLPYQDFCIYFSDRWGVPKGTKAPRSFEPIELFSRIFWNVFEVLDRFCWVLGWDAFREKYSNKKVRNISPAFFYLFSVLQFEHFAGVLSSVTWELGRLILGWEELLCCPEVLLLPKKRPQDYRLWVPLGWWNIFHMIFVFVFRSILHIYLMTGHLY